MPTPSSGTRLITRPGWHYFHDAEVFGEETTHIAFSVLVAEALEAVAEAARLRVTCRQGVPSEVLDADRALIAALDSLAAAKKEALGLTGGGDG